MEYEHVLNLTYFFPFKAAYRQAVQQIRQSGGGAVAASVSPKSGLDEVPMATEEAPASVAAAPKRSEPAALVEEAAISAEETAPKPKVVPADNVSPSPRPSVPAHHCQACQKPFKKPFSGPCGHLACYVCWDQVNGRCPTCMKTFKLTQLRPKFFA